MNRNKNEITITDEESRTCLLDNKKFESSRKMIWYVRKTYQLSFEDYIYIASGTTLQVRNRLDTNNLNFDDTLSETQMNNYQYLQIERIATTDIS